MNRLETRDYEKSLKIESVALNKFSKKEMAKMLGSKDTITDRQKNAQALCDYLNEKFGMPKCKVIVTDTAQPHSTNSMGNLKSKELGNYRPHLMVITLFNKTAVKKQTVAIKTLTDTLLHEYIHHYDMEFLKLGASPHTSGFYKRISDLKSKLI